ncbi:GroES-like protein [Biscogniauxia marginata]|nr:GroES-like protein [Biscogniauxia marginata]
MSIQQYQTTKQGGPFSLVTAPKPTPGPKEVCIRPRAVALNGIDWKNLKFGATVRSWPAVLGIDGAGTVESVGEGVTAFKPGDEVMSYAHGIQGNGAFQDIYTVSENEVAKKPAALSFEEAASLPICFLTAAAAIVIGLKVAIPGLAKTENQKPLRSILILGGSSAVGSAAIQLLRLTLPSVAIITTSSAAHHAHLKSLGATACLERAAQQDSVALKAATPGGAGVDAILDAVGAGPDAPAVFDALRPDGPKLYSLVITRPDAKVPDGLEATLVGGPSILEVAPNAMHYLAKLFEEGKYKLPVKVEVVGKGFQAVESGLERFPANVSGTKLVVTL